MKLNIKNARRLETSIDDQIARVLGKMRRDFTTYSNASEALSNTKVRLDSNLSLLYTLKEVRMVIRNSIGEFNVVKGINKVTADIAIAVSDLELYETLSELKDVSTNRAYGTEDVTYSAGIDEETREVYYAETLKLKRVIQRLKDKCQGINSSGTIELSAETESFLKKAGLVD